MTPIQAMVSRVRAISFAKGGGGPRINLVAKSGEERLALVRIGCASGRLAYKGHAHWVSETIDNHAKDEVRRGWATAGQVVGDLITMGEARARHPSVTGRPPGSVGSGKKPALIECPHCQRVFHVKSQTTNATLRAGRPIT